MKKFVIVVVVVVSSICGVCQAYEVGDVVLFTGQTFTLGGYGFFIPLFEMSCTLMGREYPALPVHSEIIVDKDGRCWSSIQGEGTRYSTIEEVIENFLGSITVETDLTSEEEQQLLRAIGEIDEFELPYGYSTYDGMGYDFLFNFVFGSCVDDLRIFTEILHDNYGIVCSEADALAYEKIGKPISIKEVRVSSPLDILRAAMDKENFPYMHLLIQ